MPPARPRGLSTDAIARMLGVAPKTVRGWVSDAGCPHNLVDGRITLDPRAVEAWLKTRPQQGVVGRGRPPGTSGPGAGGSPATKEAIACAQLEKILVQVESAKMSLAKKRGELLSREEVEAGRVARCVLLRSGFLAMASRLTPMLVGRDPRTIEATIDGEVRRILSEFAGQPIDQVKQADGAKRAKPKSKPKRREKGRR